MARRTPSIDRRVGAFTLAESLIASVVLAVAVVGVSGAIVASQKQNDAQEGDCAALTFARQLMEEIASRPLSLPDGTAGWPTVTSRSAYDTINDYNGYTDTVSTVIYHSDAGAAAGSFSSAQVPATAVTSGLSSIHLGTGQYSRTVTVTYPTTIFGMTLTSGDFAVVTLTVQGSDARSVTISKIFSKLSITR